MNIFVKYNNIIEFYHRIPLMFVCLLASFSKTTHFLILHLFVYDKIPYTLYNIDFEKIPMLRLLEVNGVDWILHRGLETTIKTFTPFTIT